MVDKISYRIDYTKVDEDLNNFPVCVWVTTDTVPVAMFNSFFTTDTFKPTRFKVVNPLTDLELYTEISYYDYNNKEMELYVKIPIIYHDKYTYLDIVPISSGTSMYVCTTDGYVVDTTISGDEFIGNDYAFPNSNLWKDQTKFYLYNNQLVANLNSSSSTIDAAYLYANYFLKGDFDIQIDVPYMDWNIPSSTSYPFICMIFVSFEGESDYFRLSVFSETGDLGKAQIRINNATDISYYYAPSSTKMRIVRNGSNITGYFWDNNKWQWDGDPNGYTYTSMPLSTASFYIGSEASYSYVNVKYDNFKINSGTVIRCPSTNVWDSNFKAVYHMSQDPSTGGACILDSTSNANHGTPYGNMTSDDLVEAPVGKALDFDGVDDYIQLPDKIPIGAKTITLQVNPIDAIHDDIDYYLFGEGNNSSDSYGSAIFWRHSIQKFMWILFHHVSSDYLFLLYSSELSPANMYNLTLIWDGTINTNGVKCYVNGILDTQGTAVGTETVNPSNNTRIGMDYSSLNRQFEGLIGQVQINNGVRSAAWIKAMHYSLKNELITPVYPTNCIGIVKNDSNIVLEGVKINLHRRIDGALVGTTTTTMSGTFCIGSPYVEDHYIVALSNDDNFNALIYDYINPTCSGGI